LVIDPTTPELNALTHHARRVATNIRLVRTRQPPPGRQFKTRTVPGTTENTFTNFTGAQGRFPVRAHIINRVDLARVPKNGHFFLLEINHPAPFGGDSF